MERRDASRTAKRELRRHILAVRDRLAPQEKARSDRQITERVLALKAYREAQAVLAYASYLSEVDTMFLIRQALEDGKDVFAPKVSGQEMEFWRITSTAELQGGYRGIPEPAESVSFPTWMLRQEKGVRKVLMWMPGAVFDRERHRIGYGKGFYDRYLCRLQSTEGQTPCGQAAFRLTTAALAYTCQVVEQIPCEAHDVRPDMLITETETYMDGAEAL